MLPSKEFQIYKKLAINSPYLDAIQALKGSKPGEKHRELNSIIKLAASSAKISRAGSIISIDLNNVPEPLVPLVRLEVAKILKLKRIIADALVSEDLDIVNRALRAIWFFQSSNKTYINPKYFRDNLLPFVSKCTRKKILKNLVTGFKLEINTALAEEFYSLISNLYGNEQAQLLLESCGDDFIWNEVYEKSVVLTRHVLGRLFRRSPNLIIRYLKLLLPSEKKKPIKFKLLTYLEFYPHLIRNHYTETIGIFKEGYGFINPYGCLGKKAIDRFLKSHMDAVLQQPTLSTQIVPMSTLAKKITNAQCKELLFNVFPRELHTYSYSSILLFLEPYPKNEKISLMLETYEKVYGCSLLDDPSLITHEIMKILPEEERVRQARIKLKTDNNWRQPSWSSVKEIWRCYLSKDEILPQIKADIGTRFSWMDRSCLLEQWIYVCSINDDEEELLRCLEYFKTRCKDDHPELMFRVMRTLCEMFKLKKLSQAHWTVIEDCLQYPKVKNVIKRDHVLIVGYMHTLMHRKILNNRSVDEEMTLLVHANEITSPLKLEPTKICLKKYFDMLLVPSYGKWRVGCHEKLLEWIVSSIYSFNRKRGIGKKLSLRNYEWVFVEVKMSVTQKPSGEDDESEYTRVHRITQDIKWNEPDILAEWFSYTSISSIYEYELDSGIATKVLKEDSWKIIGDIYEYFKCMKEFKHFRGNRQLFIKACRWREEIPITLFTLCLKSMKRENRSSVIVILSLLVERPVFLKIVDRMVGVSCFSRPQNNS